MKKELQNEIVHIINKTSEKKNREIIQYGDLNENKRRRDRGQLLFRGNDREIQIIKKLFS